MLNPLSRIKIEEIKDQIDFIQLQIINSNHFNVVNVGSFPRASTFVNKLKILLIIWKYHSMENLPKMSSHNNPQSIIIIMSSINQR